jgi:hypothetical protein
MTLEFNLQTTFVNAMTLTLPKLLMTSVWTCCGIAAGMYLGRFIGTPGLFVGFVVGLSL